MKQIILSSKDNYSELDSFINNNNISNIFVVCLKHIKKLNIYNYLIKNEHIKLTFFCDFEPNPQYEAVCRGVEKFRSSGCNYIFAIGGGSALDVAKCIKLYSNLNPNINYLKQEIIPNDVGLLAVPTTAGTGSEATKFAVIYYNGVKQSISHNSCLPTAVLFDSSLLNTLPIYQKKATMLDALSHAFESMWSINSNDESKKYSKEAIEYIIKNYDSYLNGNSNVNELMLMASNLAGCAINITQTTAGHAMCYELTSLYGISHGHAAALINSELLSFMMNNIDKCIDKRGNKYLMDVFENIRLILGLNNSLELSNYLRKLLIQLNLYDLDFNMEDIDILVQSVNVTRLKNNPIKLEKEDIKKIYLSLFMNIERMRKVGSKRILKSD